jgi:hypothetical protein
MPDHSLPIFEPRDIALWYPGRFSRQRPDRLCLLGGALGNLALITSALESRLTEPPPLSAANRRD